MSTETLSPDLEYYIGKLQPQYESKGQEMIGRMLDQYGIAFYYKDPYLLWENGERKVKRPDFTLPTYNLESTDLYCLGSRHESYSFCPGYIDAALEEFREV